MNGNVIRTITIRGQAEGLDKLTADINKLAAAQGGVALVADDLTKKQLSLAAAWKQQTLRLDEAARAQNNIARETKIANRALEEGLATQAQHAKQLELINQRYTATAAATKIVTQQTGLARHELVNLGRQAQDVGVSLMSGQSPFTVLVQQGTQIADVFATSGGTLRGFFSQGVSWAKTFLTSTTGIVTAVLAIGAAIAYAAVKFMDAGKTIEDVLKEEQRLLKETKGLIDEKTSLEAKAQLQARAQTTFEVQRNQIQLQIKLNDALRETSALVAKAATRPTQVAGEMGEAPTAVSAAGMAPGFEKIAAAREKLNAAMKAGHPSFVAFNEELAKVGQAHPELALTVEKLIAANAEGVNLEQAAARTKAMADALAGLATNAQLAAVGLGSIAQFRLSNIVAKEAAEATERQAKATLQIAAAYPGMSIEHAKQIKSLEDQLELIDAAENGTMAQVKAQQAYTKAIESGATPATAKQLAMLTQAVEEEQEWADAVRERAREEEEAAQAEQQMADARRQANNDAIDAINAQNAYLQQQLEIYNEIEAAIGFSAARQADFDPATGRITITRFGSSQYWTKDGQDTQFNPAGYQSGGAMDISTQLGSTQSGGFDYAAWQTQQAKEAQQQEAIYGPGGFTASEFQAGKPTTWTPTEAGLTFALTKTIEGILGRSGSISEAFNTALASGVTGNQLTQQLIDLAPKDQQASMIGAAIEAVSRQPATLAREQLLKQLTDKMEGLTTSTDALNATMQNALSPYYSQDPRTTKLGFRAGVVGNPDWLTGATNATALDAILGPGATAPGMAGGGSFVVGGGYSSIDNKIARFPVASGEQVIVNRRPGGQATVVNNDNRIVINGNVDQDTLSKMKVSRFQQAQRMRSASAA